VSCLALCRGTETEEQVQKRLRNAKAELEQGRTSGLFDHILVNDDLGTCYQNLKVLIFFLPFQVKTEVHFIFKFYINASYVTKYFF